MVQADGSELKLESEPTRCSSVWRAFIRQARARPGATAVIDGDLSLTYAELARRADELAARLRRTGPGGGTGGERLTGVCLTRSAHLVVAMLAALRDGGLVPLDPEAPSEYRWKILAETAPGAIVVADDLAVPTGIALVKLGGTGSGGRTETADYLAEPETGPECAQTAYVIYTSGSTGTPKGVVVEHGALAEHIRAFGERFGIGPDDRYLLFASPVTDVGVEQVLVPLVHGATLVVRSPGIADVPVRFWDFVRDARLSVVNVPAGYWRLLLAFDADGPARCSDLRWMIVGSDVLPADLAARWSARETARLVNAYGPTETVITASTRTVAPERREPGTSSVPLGEPLEQRNMRILDAELRPVAPGEVGEVWLSGLTARGYLHDPRRTATAFLPDPWRSGQRVYRTGDLARLLPDGQAEFVGRVDRQLKLDGFRVEPAALEATARAQPGVADCAAVPARIGARVRLVLLVVATPEGVDPAGLRAALTHILPGHTVPGSVHVVDELPLGPDGTIDATAASDSATALLAAMGSNGANGADDADRTDHDGTGTNESGSAGTLQRELLELWRAAFGRPAIGLDDDFVGLGGDSMTSLAIACQAPSLGLRLRPRDIFEARTVRNLARHLDSADPAGATGADAPSSATTGQGVSATPATLWLAHRLGEIPRLWCQYVLADLALNLDLELLEDALRDVTRRHPILTSVLVREGEEWVHEPRDEPQDLIIDTERLTGLDDEARLHRLRQRLMADVDPATGRMLKAAYVEGPVERRRLLLVAHHTVVDGVSWLQLLRDLGAAYRLRSDGWGIPATEPALDARGWAAASAEVVRSGGLDTELEHWTTVTAAANALPLPTEAGKERDARTVTIELAAGPLATGPENSSYRLAERLLAAVLSVWHRHGGGERCVVEMESTGRDSPATPRAYGAVGWLTALYPMVIEVSTSPAATLRKVREANRSIPGDGAGYGLLRWHHPDRAVRESLSLTGLPHLAFNFLGSLAPEGGHDVLSDPAAIEAGPLRGSGVARPCPLVVESWMRGGALTVALEFDGRRTSQAVAERFVAELRADLARLVEDGPGGNGRAAAEFPLTPAQEGMLFHTLADGDPDRYVGQLAVELAGPLSRDRFVSAWQTVCLATPPLRTAFAWRRQPFPTQHVHAHGEIPVTVHEWPNGRVPMDPARELLAAERARPFALEKPPLLRVALAATGPERHVCVVTHHHLILDGWSMNLLVHDLIDAYARQVAGRGRELRERPPAGAVFPGTGDHGAGIFDEPFWTFLLRGMRPTNVVPAGRTRSGEHRETSVRIPAGEWAALLESARDSGLTPAALVHLSWARVLAFWSGSRDVTFGTVLSGRDSAIPGIDQVSGMLINSLPYRLWLDSDRPGQAQRDRAADLLLALQERQHDSLVRIRAAAGLTPKDTLFDHVLDFGTARTMLSDSASTEVAGLRIHPLASRERTNYPVTITAYADEALELIINHDDGLVTTGEAAELLEHLIQTVAETPGTARVRGKDGQR